MELPVSQQLSGLQIKTANPESTVLLLPRELRDMIYGAVVDQLVDNDPDLFVCPSGGADGTMSVRKRTERQDRSNCSRSGILNLRQASQSIHEESDQFLYSKYTFLWPFRHAYHGFLKDLTEYQRRLIRDVSIEVDSYSLTMMKMGAGLESQRHIRDDIEAPRLIREFLPGLRSVVCQAVWEDNPGDTDCRRCFEHLVYLVSPVKSLRSMNFPTSNHISIQNNF